MWGYLAAGAGTVAAGLLIADRLFPFLRTDIVQIYIQVRVLLLYKWYVWRRRFLVDALEENAASQPNKTFLIFQDNEYSYDFMNKQANRVAHVAKEKLGLKKGDIVALLCHNEPAFFWTFFGLAKVGVQVAFVNFNLRAQSLLHSLKVCDASKLFIGQGDNLIQAVEEIAEDLGPELKMYTQGHGQVPPRFTKMDELLEDASDTNIDRPVIVKTDILCYIFTSGTTGLPKAAVISQLKQLKAGCLMRFYNLNSDDIIYCPLPLYHSAGSMIGCGNTVLAGATLVLRSRFSASQYWDDCCRHKVTIVHYIGELCRYLVNMPEHPKETKHCVRLGFGNGLRRDVWTEFQRRFNIPVIGEFYAATEGNGGFINVLNTPGAVGRLSPFVAKLYPCRFIQYDFETADPLRDENGRCHEVALGEPGLMVTKVVKDFEYDGYKNNEELSRKKIIRDVFKAGDAYFNSGDLFTQDSDYNIYFCDRLGDTFRWKGENVSTIEVSNVVAVMPKIQDANVYGVLVPGSDGRAGMATVTLVNCAQLTESELQALFASCTGALPAYAVPRFLRVCKEMKVSSTHKQLKTDLVKEGFDPNKCNGDPLFYADFKLKTYKPLDNEAYQNILNGHIRL